MLLRRHRESVAINLETIIMASLQDEVKRVCDLADGVLDDPSKSVKVIAMAIGLNYLGGVLLAPISHVLMAAWVAKKLLNPKKHEEEKERMLREVIRKQQAVIKRLEDEQARLRKQNADNRKEIEHLKEILKILERTEAQLRAA